MQGAKQIFGKRIGFELGKVLAKVAIVGGAAAMSLVPLITHLGRQHGHHADGAGRACSTTAPGRSSSGS